MSKTPAKTLVIQVNICSKTAESATQFPGSTVDWAVGITGFMGITAGGILDECCCADVF